MPESQEDHFAGSQDFMCLGRTGHSRCQALHLVKLLSVFAERKQKARGQHIMSPSDAVPVTSCEASLP